MIQNIENYEYSIRTMQEISRIPVELKLTKIYDRWMWEKSDHILEKNHEENLNYYKSRFIKHLEHQNLPIGGISWIEQQLQISGWEPPKTRGRPRQPK